MEAAATEYGKHTKTDAIRQSLLADGVARRSRSWMGILAML